MKNCILITVALIITLFLFSATGFAKPEIPANLKWQTNNSEQAFGSPEAKTGGKFHTSILSFPMTFRTVGPDSNGGFRSAIGSNQLSLIGIHPNTEKIIPELATHWAFGDDKKTIVILNDS